MVSDHSANGPKQPVSKATAILRGLLSAAALGFAVTFWISSLDAAGVKGLDLAYVYLVALWIISLVGTLIAESVLVLTREKRWQIFLVVAGSVGVFCIATGLYEKVKHTQEVMLVPGSKEYLTLGCSGPLQPVGVFLGSNWDGITSFPFDLMVLNGKPIFTIDLSPDELTIKKVVLFDDRHDRIAEIDDNVIWVRNDTKADRPDKSTLIVYDHNADEALKIEYLNKSALLVGGIYRNNRYPVLLHDDEMEAKLPSGHYFKISNSCFKNSALTQTDDATLMLPKTKDDGIALRIYDGGIKSP